MDSLKPLADWIMALTSERFAYIPKSVAFVLTFGPLIAWMYCAVRKEKRERG